MEDKPAQGNEPEEKLTHKQQAREDFKNQIKMQMKSMGMSPPSADPTDEELDGMIKKRMEGLKSTIREKETSLRVDETYLARVAANRDVLINVDLKEAETEWHKKAVQAEVDELQAIIEEKKIKFEKDKEAVVKLQEDLKKVGEML
jgi:hypothetical protein